MREALRLESLERPIKFGWARNMNSLEEEEEGV